MAHVHKQTYTQEIPKKAELVAVKGKGQLYRWKGRSGAWVFGVPIPEKPGRCRCESAKWYVTYYDHTTREEKTIPGYTDRAATDALMVKLVKVAAQVDSGLLPAEAQRTRRTLTELLDRWRTYTRHRSSEGGARRRHQRASAIVEGLKVTRAADLTPSSVLGWVSDQAEAEGWAAETAVMYLSAVKGFTRWLVLTEKAESVDHLSGLAASFDGDVHRKRRSLSAEQLTQLLDATAESTRSVAGLTPAERHALYLAACSTGLRAVELSRLTAQDLDRSREEVTLRKPAKAKGQSRTDVLPLEEAVIDCILGACACTGPLWPVRTKASMVWWGRAAEMLREDLAAAGIEYRDSEGRVFDFHCLRGQYITDLDRAGVTLARAQKLARHSKPEMTAKHYHKPEREELARDSAKLGRGKLVKKPGKRNAG